MSPFWRRASPPPPSVDPVVLEYRSHALTFLLAERPAGVWRVLDLGPASNANLAFFASLGATYAVAELWATMAPCRRAGRIDAECLRGMGDLFSDAGAEPFHLILAWDLLDYLMPAALGAFGERLAPLTATGSRLHALTSMNATQPARPGKCTVADVATIRLRPEPGPHALPCPRYTEAALAQALRPLAPHKSYLLKHHMREHVLERPAVPR